MSKYLEKSQLSYLWQKIKDYVASQKVSTSFQFSTSEQFTGDYWVDGKKIYIKSVYVVFVPAPAAGKQNAFLCGDGSWAVPTNTTYEVVNENSNGLMTPAMLSKLESINEVYSMATNAKELANEAYNTIGTLETNIEATYAKKADVVGMYKYKGSVTNSSNLPTNNQTKGDVYNIVNASS